MSRLILITLVLAGLLVIGAPGCAQPLYNVVDSIQVAVENPTGFISPGGRVQINLRVTNPEGSGLVLERVSGANHGSRPAPTRWTGSNYYPWPEVCDQSLPCAVEGKFPVGEGESVLLAYRTIAAVEPIPVGSFLGFTTISLQFETTQHEIDVYADQNVAYQVTEDGSGDPAVFEDYLIELPPLVVPSLAVVFDYPRTLDAGAHFNLRATIANKGPEAVAAVSLSSNWIPLGAPQSQHDSFLMQPCSRSCDLVPGRVLNPGASATWDVANYYYVDEILQGSEVIIESLYLSVSDQSGRRFSMAPDSLPLRITVNGPVGGPVANPEQTLPARLPLQSADFLSAGDGLLIHDPNTGYDWVRLHASMNISHQEMQQYLASLDELEEFRVARSSEVHRLALNYVHAAGVPAYEFQLLNGADAINAALFNFIELIGITGDPSPWFNPFSSGGSTLRATGGFVADKPGLSQALPDWGSVVSVTSNDPSQLGMSFPRGLLSESMPHIIGSQRAGHWLVRTHTTPPAVIPAGPHYRDDELVIPALRIGAETLAVTLNFRNPVGALLQVTGVEAAGPEADAITVPLAEFDVASGRLSIHQLAVEVEPDQFLDLEVLLDYLPGSDPPTFVARSVVPVQMP